MVADDELCNYYKPRKVYVWVDVVFFSLFFVATLAFSYKFVCEMKARKKDSDALSRFVHAYIIQAVLFSLYGLYVVSLENFRQKDFGLSLAFCGFCNWSGLSLTSGCYVTLQHILFIRLYMAFKKTKWAVSRRMRVGVRVFHAVAFGLSFTMVTMYAALSDCFYETKSVGVHWPIYWCAPRPKYSFTTFSHYWIGGFVIIVGNVVLAFMYVWRLRVALLGKKTRGRVASLSTDKKATATTDVNSSATTTTMTMETRIRKASIPQRYRDDRSRHVIRKSTVIAVVSILSTLFAFVLVLLGLYNMIYLDILFNEVLLYCLYTFGDDLYQKVFARFHCCVDPFLPANAFEDDDVHWDLSTTRAKGESQTSRPISTTSAESTTNTNTTANMEAESTTTTTTTMEVQSVCG